MKKYLNLIIVLISAATVVSGLVQVFVPGFVLGMIGAQVDVTTGHFFRIIGMFMALFGGLMLHAVYHPHSNRVAVLWCALQKLGAFAAVSIGILNRIFSPMAFAVAGFDLLSGLLFLYYWKTLKAD